ncbi:MAG: hypothetical protein WKG01_26680 [Kofleriaceae bacterium]
MTASRIVRASLVAGSLVAVLDLAGAMVLAARHGRTPIQVLHAVASGILRNDAYAGGMTTALVGLAIHTGIALTVATLFMLVASRVRMLTRRPWLWGPLYGLGVWGVMYFVVLPLRWPANFPPTDPEAIAGQLGCHVFLVGLPIAIVASRMLRRG